MSSWTLAITAAKHVAKHGTLAKFTGHEEHDPDTSNEYSIECGRFEKFHTQLKKIYSHISEFKKVIQDCYSKAGLFGQKLVELTSDNANSLMMRSNRTRTIIARVQAALLRKMIPDIDNILLNEISDQLLYLRDVKSRISKRLETVADANHYTEKFKALKLEMETRKIRAPEKITPKNDEKLERNREKQETAIRQLKEETEGIMESMRSINRQRKHLMTTRCNWLRNILHVFLSEVVQSYDLVNEASPQHELLDVGSASPQGFSRRASGAAATVADYRKKLSVNMQHAAKHKGGLTMVFGASGKSNRDLGSSVSGDTSSYASEDSPSAYELAIDRFKRQQQDLRILKEALAAYLDGLKAVCESFGNVTTDLVEMGVPDEDESEDLRSALLLQQTWDVSTKQIVEDIVVGLTQEGINVLADQLEFLEKVTQISLSRKQAALDVTYYMHKLKQLSEKEQKSSQISDGERFERNKKKEQQAHATLESTTSHVMELITSFDTTRQKILLSLIESYEVRERRAFQIAATQLVSPVDQIDILDARDEKVLSAKDPGTATVSNTTSCRRLSKDGVPATSIATIAAEVNSGDEITRTFPNPFGRPKAELAPTPSSNTSSNAPITSAPPPRISEVKSMNSALLKDMDQEVNQSKYMEVQAQKRASLNSVISGGTPAMMEACVSQTAECDALNIEEATQVAEANVSCSTTVPKTSAKVLADRIVVKALFDFEGVQDGDLPFRDGDEFEASASEFALHATDGGWVTGWHKGSEGMFPSNYVERKN